MRFRKMGVLASAIALSVGVAACGSSSGGESANNSSASNGSSGGGSLVGAGSTLVQPLVSQWVKPYEEETEVALAYSGIGSGGGIAQITARTVDFGASDAPLTEDQFKEAKGVVQIPWALAATCVAYNVEGVPNELKVTGPLLAEIYEGKITNWNDPKIAALNPGVKFPNEKITPVYRSDGSGDTYAFTNYLSKISPEWKSKIGFSTQVSFPTGVSGKGNSGVGGAISSTPGSIGYIAIAYVLENKFNYALVENAAGKFPVPGIKSIAAAAAALTKIPSDNNVSIVDPPASAAEAYPISTFTYSLIPLSSPKASTLKPFLKWAITKGQKFDAPLDFAPLPPQIIKVDEETIEKVK